MEIVKAAVALAAKVEEGPSTDGQVKYFLEIFNESVSRPHWLKRYRKEKEGSPPWWKINVYMVHHTAEVEADIREKLASAGWGIKEVIRKEAVTRGSSGSSNPAVSGAEVTSYLIGTLEDYPAVG